MSSASLKLVSSTPMTPGPRELDIATLGRAQRGDAAACRALVLQYEARLFAYVARTVGALQADRVDDICQEAFLRVFRAIDRFDPNGPAQLSTWIFTIATRLCFDAARRDRRRMALAFEEPEGLASADAVAMERALRRRIDRALMDLPEHLRTTFALRVIGELSVKETAAALSIDEGTVKSRLARAREQLRAAIGEV